MQVGRDYAMFEAQRHLDEASDAGPRLQMADVGFDRADEAFFTGLASGAEGAAKGPCLDRVSYRSASSVSFDILNFMG